jgi:hypothetical protein
MLYITKKYSISITTQTKSKVKVFMNTVVGEFECDAVLDWSLDNDTLGLVTSDAILLYNIPTKNMKTMQGNFTNIFIEKNFYKIGNGYLQNEKKKIAKARPGLLRVFNQKAAIASNQIEIIDVKTKEKIILPGHATQIHQLLFKKYLFSAAVEDRFITRWELDGTSTSYIVDSCPVQIDANDSHLIALCEDGRVAIWDIEYPGEPQGYIELNRDNEPFISAALDGVYCLVAYGNELAPEFEKVLFLDENQNVLSQLVLTRVDSAKVF